MGRHRGAIGVSCRTRSYTLPFFHEKFLAEELKLRVGAARGGGRGMIPPVGAGR